MTKQYIKAYIVFGALTYTALFVFGLVLGMVVFMTQGHDAANGLDNQPWFAPLSQIMFFITILLVLGILLIIVRLEHLLV